MAHQHGFVIFDRIGRGPGLNQWDEFDKTYGRILDGSLLLHQRTGLPTGPGNTSVNFLGRCPFAQA